MLVQKSLSVRGVVLMEERPMGEAQTGEEPMEEVLTAKVPTEQAPMEEVTTPLRRAHSIFKK